MLRKQNDELTKINKELDSFIYSVSHDLRSPLSSILGLVNVAKLETKESKETIDSYFYMIEQSVLKLDNTLREILDYSRNARGEIIITEVNLAQLIDNALEQLKHVRGFNEVKFADVLLTKEEKYFDELLAKVLVNESVSNYEIPVRTKANKKSIFLLNGTHRTTPTQRSNWNPSL